jgi:ribosomal protein L31E
MTRVVVLIAALVFGGIVAAPYLLAQTPAPSVHEEHALPAGHPPVAAAPTAQSAMHEKMMAHMKAADAKVDALIAKATASRGDAKVDALLEVIAAMREQNKAMHDGMMQMHTAMHGSMQGQMPMGGAR